MFLRCGKYLATISFKNQIAWPNHLNNYSARFNSFGFSKKIFSGGKHGNFDFSKYKIKKSKYQNSNSIKAQNRLKDTTSPIFVIFG